MNWWTTISANIEPKFNIGEVTFHYYGLMIALALIAGLSLATHRARSSHYSRPEVETAFMWAVIPALIGARLYHVIDNLGYYVLRPFDILAVWQGGLGIYGAIIGAVSGLVYAAHKQKVKLLWLLDLFAPSAALGQAIGRWGNFFNQEGYGPPTNLPWKIYIDPARRVPAYADNDFFHPLFLYESLWNLVVFGILMLLARRKLPEGFIAASYLILYGLGRFVIEFGRLDTAMWAGVKVAHIISAVFVASGILFMIGRHFSSPLIKSSSNHGPVV